MRRCPALWRHIVVPVLINLVLTGLLLASLIALAPQGLAWMEARFDGGWLDTLLKWLAYAASAMLLLGLVAGFWMLSQGLLCSWFYGNLARDVELGLGTDPAELRELPVLREIADALRATASVALVSLSCMLLGLVPLLAPIAAAAAFYFNSMTFAVEYLGYPLALRGIGLKEQRAFAKAHRPQCLGLGGGIMLLAFVPVLNSVLLATAVTGSVLLHRDLRAAKQRLAA
jgi:uncharacterized protein involved in cysteine biosynthesis